MKRPLKLAFFATGNGTALRSVASAVHRAELTSSIELLISNNQASGAIAWARNHDLDTLVIAGESERDENLSLNALEEHQIDLILLTGYMRKIGPKILNRYAPNIWNIHPALLPKYGGKGMYGRHVHKAVLEAHERQSGATLQVIDPEYDTGPILMQSAIPIAEAETMSTLETRIKSLECELLITGIRHLERGELYVPT